jgi:DNA adenine methylase
VAGISAINMATVPPLKWVGGKTQLLKEVLDAFPPAITSYHEPFVGGGSVLLEVLQRVGGGTLTVSGGFYASDSNERLIWLYRHIQRSPVWLARNVNELADTYASIELLRGRRDAASEADALESREAYYYWLRRRFNASSPDSLEGSAMFLVINRLCFRGLYRVGPNGFNVPFGHYATRPAVPTLARMLALSQLLASVEFTVADFGAACSRAVDSGDLVYLDPPYVPVSATSFVSYTDGGFPAASHKRLLNLLRELPERGVTAIMSNSVAPVVLQACDGLDVREVTAKRRVNSKAPGSTAQEVIVVSRPA